MSEHERIAVVLTNNFLQNEATTKFAQDHEYGLK